MYSHSTITLVSTSVSVRGGREKSSFSIKHLRSLGKLELWRLSEQGHTHSSIKTKYKQRNELIIHFLSAAIGSSKDTTMASTAGSLHVDMIATQLHFTCATCTCTYICIRTSGLYGPVNFHERTNIHVVAVCAYTYMYMYEHAYFVSLIFTDTCTCSRLHVTIKSMKIGPLMLKSFLPYTCM